MIHRIKINFNTFPQKVQQIWKFTNLIPPVHCKSMRLKLKLHKSATKLTVHQKGVYYSNIKIYNKILDVIAELVSDKKCFNTIEHIFN